MNRILSGRKSSFPKWRRKTRRAAILLGLDESTDINAKMNDIEGERENENYPEADHDWNTWRNYPSSSMASDINNPLYSDDTIWNVSRGGGSSRENEQECESDNVVCSDAKSRNEAENDSTTMKGRSRNRIRNWRGSNKERIKSEEDEVMEMGMYNSNNNIQKSPQSPSYDYQFKPVPPSTSTIVRIMKQFNSSSNNSNSHVDGDDDNQGGDMIQDYASCLSSSTSSPSAIVQQGNEQKRRFKRPKLKILKYSQHRQRSNVNSNSNSNNIGSDLHRECQKQEKDKGNDSKNEEGGNMPLTSLSSPSKRSSLFPSKHGKKRKNNLQQQQQSFESSSSFSSPSHPRRLLTKEEQTKAKLQWAAKYTSLATLRQTFGRNRNKFWGDFDSQTTRKLYHTLLPRALLGLYDIGLWSPTELAPLAYEARLAAKKYARERCVVPSRIMAMFYDGFRMWRDWGTWSVEGMSWEQVWDKYETQVLEEMMEDCQEDRIDRDWNQIRRDRYDDNNDNHDEEDEGCCVIDLNEISVREEITAQICLRILERSCVTNGMVDRLFLEEHDGNNIDNDSKSGIALDSTKDNQERSQRNGSYRKKRRRRRRNAERDLARIRIRLERDIQELLQSNEEIRKYK